MVSCKHGGYPIFCHWIEFELVNSGTLLPYKPKSNYVASLYLHFHYFVFW